MTEYKRHTLVGTLCDVYAHLKVFVTVKWDGKRLSMTGVTGPRSNGDASGSCGQNVADITSKDFAPAAGIDADHLARLWNSWHLNDMKAGCEHQRANWHLKATAEPSSLPDWSGNRIDGRPMLSWVTQSEHPEGMLSKPCEVCGYKYGSAWLHEDVPASVIEWLKALPDNGDKLPKAWR